MIQKIRRMSLGVCRQKVKWQNSRLQVENAISEVRAISAAISEAIKSAAAISEAAISEAIKSEAIKSAAIKSAAAISHAVIEFLN